MDEHLIVANFTARANRARDEVIIPVLIPQTCRSEGEIYRYLLTSQRGRNTLLRQAKSLCRLKCDKVHLLHSQFTKPISIRSTTTDAGLRRILNARAPPLPPRPAAAAPIT